MTLLLTTVFLAGDDGGNTADANDKKHHETKASGLQIAVGFFFIDIYITKNQF
jgi:hypothetical protein